MKTFNPATTLEALPTCEALKTTSTVASCEKNHATLRATAGSRKNWCGSGYAYGHSGDFYYVDGHEYIVTETGEVVDYKGEDIPEDRRDAIRSIIEKQIEEDNDIERARAELAKIESRGDRIKFEILLMHLWFTGGIMEEGENKKDGIEFYQVGRNASHNFYCGVKDGQRYVASWCPGECLYENEESPTESTSAKQREEQIDDFEHQASVRPVAAFEGLYMGHC